MVDDDNDVYKWLTEVMRAACTAGCGRQSAKDSHIVIDKTDRPWCGKPECEAVIRLDGYERPTYTITASDGKVYHCKGLSFTSFTPGTWGDKPTGDKTTITFDSMEIADDDD